MTIEYTEGTSSFFRNLVASVCSKQAKRSDPQWRKQGWIPLERQFHRKKLSFFHKRETEHSFELALSICVLYPRIFNLEIQNFSLEKRGRGGGAENMHMTNHHHDNENPRRSTPLHLPYRYLCKIRSRVRSRTTHPHHKISVMPPPTPSD